MLNLTCAICTELYSHTDNVYGTVCGHIFHMHCLNQWLERSKTCPQCRAKCHKKKVYRLYFNLSNLDVSQIDVGSLQEQLENSNFQLQMKDKEIRTLNEEINTLKEIQERSKKTRKGLVEKLRQTVSTATSYAEQLKMLRNDVATMDELRKEVKELKSILEVYENVATVITGSKTDIDNILKNEKDPAKLCVLITSLKRKLRLNDAEKNEMQHWLKFVQAELRSAGNTNKSQVEKISQLESENHQLNEKIKLLEREKESKSIQKTVSLEKPSMMEKAALDTSTSSKDYSLKENLKEIAESNSPYLNIKSRGVGLAPFLKRNQDAKPTPQCTTTTKVMKLKVSPRKVLNAEQTSAMRSHDKSCGAVRKTSSDLSEKYTILKKPRLGLLCASFPNRINAPRSSDMVFNGFGGSTKLNPFATISLDDDPPKERSSIKSKVVPLPKGQQSSDGILKKALNDTDETEDDSVICLDTPVFSPKPEEKASSPVSSDCYLYFHNSVETYSHASTTKEPELKHHQT